MLDRETIAAIHGLLSSKRFSQRAIARRLGVSRGAVQAAARCNRPAHSPLQRSAGDEFCPGRGAHVRCPGCGGKVRMPCLACYLRKRNRKQA
jgi:hypothetical protein